MVPATGRRPRYCCDACKMVAYRQRKRRSVHFRSDSPEWETPQDFFDAVNARHHFTLGVCATPDNAKCAAYYTRRQDGLLQPWTGRVWCNPPYGREVGLWVKRAALAVERGEAELVCCLVAARTDTAWWHEWATRAEVEFLRGRLRFGGGENAAPFPSALLVFRNARGASFPLRNEG